MIINGAIAVLNHSCRACVPCESFEYILEQNVSPGICCICAHHISLCCRALVARLHSTSNRMDQKSATTCKTSPTRSCTDSKTCLYFWASRRSGAQQRSIWERAHTWDCSQNAVQGTGLLQMRQDRCGAWAGWRSNPVPLSEVVCGSRLTSACSQATGHVTALHRPASSCPEHHSPRVPSQLRQQKVTRLQPGERVHAPFGIAGCRYTQ
jgi:hypothetical protein